MYNEGLFYNQQLHLLIDYSGVQTAVINNHSCNNIAFDNAFREMAELEGGAIANSDEQRMVGHYWLRNPSLAPTAVITAEIENCLTQIKDFAAAIHQQSYKKVLVIGIGGSALGPRFIASALKSTTDAMELYFLDNTDPMGMDSLLSQLQNDLANCLVVVISKSGKTIETRNGLVEVQKFFADCGRDFSGQAVSISQPNSLLDQTAKAEGWLATFPLWDWVGGRTSVFSAVGLLPLVLQGVNIDNLLAGAKACDEITAIADVAKNPAALMAGLWYQLVEEQGLRQMVLLPYKDSLSLFTQYCQQLIMESIGKKLNRQGQTVHQGFSVWGNKGSTDQHSFVQQLLEGENNFFITFIQILQDRQTNSMVVGENSTSGDYLQAFLLGTDKALREARRQSVIISLPAVNSFYLGVLIALFERTVGFFALLLNINAYNQPGVERGKQCATEIIDLKNKLVEYLATHPNVPYTIPDLSQCLNVDDDKLLFNLLLHLTANPQNKIHSCQVDGQQLTAFKFLD